MKAAVFYGKVGLRVEEVPEPQEVGHDKAKIKVGYAGICGSDLHIFYYPEVVPQISTEPHPLTGAKLPQILGHEFSGTIVERGDNVTDLEVGDPGSVFPIAASCGTCPACRNGVPFSCPQQASIGANAPGGGLSEYVVVDADNFRRLPEGVDLRMGALVEPMAVGWHAVERAGTSAGESALLVGAGPVGIGAWYAFKAQGVDNVLVSEPNASRRELIAGLGARVIDPVNEDLSDAVERMTDGEGVSASVDASGAQAGFESAMASLAPTGRLSLMAMHEEPVQLNAAAVMFGQQEIVGAVGYDPQDFDNIIQAMERGVYSSEGWVVDRPLNEVADAIRDLHDGVGSKFLIHVGD